MKKIVVLMCILMPLLGFAQSKNIDETTKSIIFAAALFAILIIGALFKTFLVLRDREREKSSEHGSQYGGPVDGGGYNV